MVQLESARLSRGLMVIDVAQRLGISPCNLRRYERGMRMLPVDVAQGLGLIYGVSWWEFYPDYYPDGIPATIQ